VERVQCNSAEILEVEMAQLRICGFADDASEAELNELFSKIGTVEWVNIVRDIISGKSRGFAMARMPDNTQAEKAIEKLNGTTLRSRQITVAKMPETLPGEMEFREWLADNAFEVLQQVGVRRGHIVLDYGCGPGDFTVPCARVVGEKGKVYALEVRPAALERLKKRAESAGLGNVETILADNSVLATGLSDGSIDVTLVYDVMHAINEKMVLLEELHRVLKNDGFLSVFPMHMGTEGMLESMKNCPLFRFRDSYSLPAYKTPSEILNFNKC
jgi:SAM-dependent methyltransferase